MSRDVELAVVGAGPQALTLLCYLAHHRPDMLDAVAVFDAGDWLAAWHRQFERYRIPMLRSGCVHHPDPHPYGLIRFARDAGRLDEFSGPIGRPSTSLFADYCRHLVERYGLDRTRVGSNAAAVLPRADGNLVTDDQGRSVQASRVVLATNPVRPVVPPWLGHARARYRGEPGLLHAGQWAAERDLGACGEVVVVGGGLTAAQIVAAHARDGARVSWITRGPLRVRDLDIEAVWLGPELRRFHAARDPRARMAMARKARGGGSLPEAERREVLQLADSGLVRHIVGPIDQARPRRGKWQVLVRRHGGVTAVEAASVVCATGTRAQARFEPLLRHARAQHPARLVDGLPVLADDLAWPGTSLHLMGPLAMASVGPACRTVIGARQAAERIVSALDGRVEAQYPGPCR